MFQTQSGEGWGWRVHLGEKCAYLQKLILRQGSKSVAETDVYHI